jgi:hypothetical protein
MPTSHAVTGSDFDPGRINLFTLLISTATAGSETAPGAKAEASRWAPRDGGEKLPLLIQPGNGEEQGIGIMVPRLF